MKTESRTLHVIKCSPSGNITSLVFTPVEREFHARISQEIMRSQPDVEQVGFIESADDPAVLGRLQMMGGEFCGNAASAYFSVLSRQRHILQALIEVSGKTVPLQAALVGDSVQLKLSEKIYIRESTVPGSTIVVDMEGITHLLCEMPVPEDEKTSAADLLSANKLLDLPAAGVIFFSQIGQEFQISPVVWVKETRSLVCESACASGTMALAVWVNRNIANSGQAIKVSQPRGAVISVYAEQGAKDQVEITMQSRVTLLEEIDLKIDLEP